MQTLAELREARFEGLRVAVVAAADREVMAAVRAGLELGLAFVLVGPGPAVHELAAAEGLAAADFELISEDDPAEAARVATRLVRDGRAQILMKGLLGTADFLRPVLDREDGLRKGGLLSHVAVVELPGPRLALITDAGMNIAPALADKVEIIRNAAMVARCLGLVRPKVAVLAAVELVNPAMPPTLEAAALSKMADRGQLRGVDVDGPLALDNAILPEAAGHKGVTGAVAGMADILLVPEIVCGNVLYKALVHIAGFRAAGIVAGASAPLVVTSRADSWDTKLNSLALAALLCQGDGEEVG